MAMGLLKTRLKNGFCLFKKKNQSTVTLFSSFAHYCERLHTSVNTILIKFEIFRDRSFTLFLNCFFFAKFLEILTTGSFEIGKFLQKRCIWHGSFDNKGKPVC